GSNPGGARNLLAPGSLDRAADRSSPDADGLHTKFAPLAMSRPVYLDFHATTPVEPRVLDAMLPYFTEHFGNAASKQHSFGWEAQKAVDVARRQVAALIGASPPEIVFTSGASESNNLAIKGIVRARRDRGDHIITAPTEHKSVLDSFKCLEKEGCRVTWLGV